MPLDKFWNAVPCLENDRFNIWEIVIELNTNLIRVDWTIRTL